MDNDLHAKGEDWREICKQAACELNPDKLLDLITQLTKALDARDRRPELDAMPAHHINGEASEVGTMNQPCDSLMRRDCYANET